MKKTLKLLTASLVMLLTLAPLRSTHGMEKISMENTPKGVKGIIFDYAANPSTLRLVCKNWRKIVDNIIEINKEKPYEDKCLLSQKWLQEQYGVPGYEEIFNIFINGKLIYRPILGSDEDMIEWKISNLINPFDGTFKLLPGQDFTISTGFPLPGLPLNSLMDEGEEKIGEVRLVLWDVVKRDLDRRDITSPLEDLWEKETAPIGIFFGWKDCFVSLECFDSIIDRDIKVLSSNSIYQNWKNITNRSIHLECSNFKKVIPGLKHFTFSFPESK